MQDDRVNPTALRPAQAARIFAKLSGEGITAEMIEADILEGAPTNADGTLHLVRYAAWLARENAKGNPRER